MENKRLTLEGLKASLKSKNLIANVESIKGGNLADCHLRPDPMLGGQHLPKKR
jgi:hypothetical protein